MRCYMPLQEGVFWEFLYIYWSVYWHSMIVESRLQEEINMREVFEEYGKVVIAAAASMMLIGFATVLFVNGQVFDAIRIFSQSIC